MAPEAMGDPVGSRPRCRVLVGVVINAVACIWYLVGLQIACSTRNLQRRQGRDSPVSDRRPFHRSRVPWMHAGQTSRRADPPAPKAILRSRTSRRAEPDSASGLGRRGCSPQRRKVGEHDPVRHAQTRAEAVRNVLNACVCFRKRRLLHACLPDSPSLRFPTSGGFRRFFMGGVVTEHDVKPF